MDKLIDFLISSEMASEFKKKPVKLEKLDIEIPGIDVYSEPETFKRKKIVLSGPSC